MKKNYENYIIYGLLALVILVLMFSVYGYLGTSLGTESLEVDINSQKINSQKTNNPEINSEKAFEPIDSGSTEPGDVSVELTPYDMSNKQLKVKIAVNTHSVDLSGFDLKQIISLEYEGKTVKPASVPSLGGHHSNGELIFNIEKELNLFTIRIKGIPKVEDRIFNWQI